MGKDKGHIPVRTCVSCGAKRSRYDLIRLLPDKEGRLVNDVSGKMHGRGAYVCKTGYCLERLSGNRRIRRLFRTDRIKTLSGLSKGYILEDRKSWLDLGD